MRYAFFAGLLAYHLGLKLYCAIIDGIAAYRRFGCRSLVRERQR